MISDKGGYSEAFVWIWLPATTAPIVAGKLTAEEDKLVFNYGKSYLGRNNAAAIVEHQISAIGENWSAICEKAGLTATDRTLLWGRQFLNAFAFDELDGEYVELAKIANGVRERFKSIVM